MKQSILLLLTLVFCIACKSSHRLGNSSAQNNVLQQRAERHIEYLNNKLFTELENIYADDFSGWAPVVEFKNKAELLQSIQRNYKNSTTNIKGKVLKVEAGIQLGYVLLNWVVYDTKEQKVVFEKNVLEIWKTNQKGEWTLSKMLFYHPDDGFGING